MLSIPVFDKNGKAAGTFEIDPEILGGIVRKKLLKTAVIGYQANQRAGSAWTLTRSEVAGTGKKQYRQKGTGGARMGMRQTNKRRGGGVAFGPKPRDFRQTLNRRARVEALRSALLAKILDKQLIGISDFGLGPKDKPSTKAVAAVLKNVKCHGKTCLIGTKDHDDTLVKSARNISGMTILSSRELNAYDVLRPAHVVLTRDALQALKDRFSHENA